MAELVLGALIGGLGTLLFSLAILQTNVAPRWVAWLGVAAAILGGLLTLLAPASEVFELINFLGAIGFWVWVLAMGVVLWRAPEPAGV